MKAAGSVSRKAGPKGVQCTRARPGAFPESESAVHLDVWLTSSTSPDLAQPLRAVIEELATCLAPAYAPARARQLAILTTIAANFVSLLALHSLDAGQDTAPPRIIVDLQNRASSRYERKELASARQLRTVLVALAESSWVKFHAYKFKKVRTTISAKPKLLTLFGEHEVTPSAITRLANEEIIVLTLRKPPRTRTSSDGLQSENDEEENQSTFPPSGNRFIDYPDSPEADYQRERLRRYNAFIAKQDIRVLGIDYPPPFRPAKRIYSMQGAITWNRHGRIYSLQAGGWHQGLKKEHRHLIRIQGQPICDLDIVAAHIHIAYALAKATLLSGDPYDIGISAERSLVKRIMVAMLARNGGLTRMPKGTSHLLPRGMTAAGIAEAVKQHHKPIAHMFGRDMSHKFMWIESEILMATLEQLSAQLIPALPMHDGIQVPASSKQVGINALQQASLKIIGVVIPVEEKPIFTST